MQRQSSIPEQASKPLSRDRCGRCASYCPSPVHSAGICAKTNGDYKQPGTVQPEQHRCIFVPSKYQPKGLT